MTVKKFACAALALALMFSMCSCSRSDSGKKEADYVVELINSFALSSDPASLQDINRAERAYNALSDAQKADVANHQALADARRVWDEAHAAPRRGRFDRSKLQIGTYCYRQSLWNDADMQKLTDAGINFIASGSSNADFLSLCEKHGVGVFVSYLPGWWGGDGNNAGGYAEAVPLSKYDEAFASFTDSPAVWAMDICDEPNAADMPHIGALAKRAEELFPCGLAYVNLYPNYANSSQLGTRSYAQHIAKYVESVDTDYICYDHYMYAVGVGRYLDNLSIVADACRASGRDLWIVLEVSDTSKLLNEQQMRFQAYSAMCYGARLINWACWTAGWYTPDLQIVDSQGNYTSMYEDLKAVNAELGRMSDEYMSYENIMSFTFGSGEGEFMASAPASSDSQDVFAGLSIDGNGSAVAGYFEKADGSSSALLIANASDINGGEGGNTVKFRVPHAAEVAACVNGERSVLAPDGDGFYSVSIPLCGGAFITAVRDEAAVLREAAASRSSAPLSAADPRAIGFGANASGFEYDLQGLSDLGVEFIAGNSGSGFSGSLSDAGIGLYACDFYYRDTAGGATGAAFTVPQSFSSYKKLTAQFASNGIVISKNDLSDIEGYIEDTPGDFYTMYAPAIKRSNSALSLDYRFLGSLAYAGKYSGEAGKALWVMLNTAESPAASLAQPSPEQLTWQIWSAFGFGAKKVIFSSYEALKNEPALLAAAKSAVAEVKKLAPVLSEFSFKTTYAPGVSVNSPKVSVAGDETRLSAAARVTALSADAPVIFCLFSGDSGSAVMLLPGDTDGLAAGSLTPSTVTLTLDGSETAVTAYVGGEPAALQGSGGVYTLQLSGAAGVFVTIK